MVMHNEVNGGPLHSLPGICQRGGGTSVQSARDVSKRGGPAPGFGAVFCFKKSLSKKVISV